MAANRPEGYINRGVLYLHLNQPGKALNDFNEAIRLDPENPENYYQRAHASWALGKGQDAYNDLQTYIAAGGNLRAYFMIWSKNRQGTDFHGLCGLISSTVTNICRFFPKISGTLHANVVPGIRT